MKLFRELGEYTILRNLICVSINHDIITAQAIELFADPRKYKPTNSLCFGYLRNFKPSKINTLKVISDQIKYQH